VIGDRFTDIELAKNLGCKAIRINGYESKPVENNLKPYLALDAENWNAIYKFLKLPDRVVKKLRKTNETEVTVELNLDGTAKTSIKTGISFFDHMLEQLGRHSGIDLTVMAKGDTHVDEHHTIEDTGIVLGEAFAIALGHKKGIERYGFCLPMDDSLAQVAIDFGGRNWIEWDVEFKREKIGDMPTEMFFHFFKSFSDGVKCNLNIKAEGDNEHHKIESIFKALAKAIKMAVKRDATNMILPTTKGSL
jgi:imidazoleglycerol-phosphate dehydratase/histidinol-phosphatase